jgi:predicted Rossmann fold flavoprotein
MALSAEVVIVGGGVAGMLLAGELYGCDYLLLEADQKCGRKLIASGGGYANVTHETLSLDRYAADRHFITPALQRFDNQSLMRLLERQGVALERREEGEIFTTQGAKALTNRLLKRIDPKRILTSCKVQEVHQSKQGFELMSTQGSIRAKKVVLATGSSAWSALKPSGSGLKLAATLSHETRPFEPALCGLTLQPPQFWMKALSGIALPVSIAVADHRCEGNLLFAHRGISGPAVLNASLWWQKGAIAINFLPGVSKESVLGYRGPKTLLSLLPFAKRLSRAFMDHLQIPALAPAQLSAAQLAAVEKLWHYEMAPAGHFGLSRAEACRGGVLTETIDPATMQSRKVPGLYLIGELLDVTGEVGGFNIQWAYSSAMAASCSLAP